MLGSLAGFSGLKPRQRPFSLLHNAILQRNMIVREKWRLKRHAIHGFAHEN